MPFARGGGGKRGGGKGVEGRRGKGSGGGEAGATGGSMQYLCLGK